MTSDCRGWLGKALGHRFHPVYDESWTAPEIASRIAASGGWIRATTLPQDHHRRVRAVVCARCGQNLPLP